jgi:hypothetical protein
MEKQICKRCNGRGRVNSFPESETMSQGALAAPDSDESLRDLSNGFTSICGRCGGNADREQYENLVNTGLRAVG